MRFPIKKLFVLNLNVFFSAQTHFWNGIRADSDIYISIVALSRFKIAAVLPLNKLSNLIKFYNQHQLVKAINFQLNNS